MLCLNLKSDYAFACNVEYAYSAKSLHFTRMCVYSTVEVASFEDWRCCVSSFKLKCYNSHPFKFNLSGM